MLNANAAANATPAAQAANAQALAQARAARAARTAPAGAPGNTATAPAPAAPAKAPKGAKAPKVALTKGQAARVAGAPGACKWQWQAQPVGHQGAVHARTVYAAGRDACGTWRGHVVFGGVVYTVTAGNGAKPAAVWQAAQRPGQTKGRKPWAGAAPKAKAPAKAKAPKAPKAPKA